MIKTNNRELSLIDVSCPAYPDLFVRVSPEDFERCAAHKWVYRSTGIVNENRLMLKRFIMGLPSGRNPVVYLKDGDMFNCTRSNLTTNQNDTEYYIKRNQAVAVANKTKIPVFSATGMPAVFASKARKREAIELCRTFLSVLDSPTVLATITDSSFTEYYLRSRIKHLSAEYSITNDDIYESPLPTAMAFADRAHRQCHASIDTSNI